MSVVPVELAGGITLPAYTTATVSSVKKTHVRFTLTDDYHITFRVVPCPKELQSGPIEKQCQVTMTNTGYIKDQLWAHWVNPKNYRIKYIGGLGFSY